MASTETLRTQYVDDLVNQRQALEDAMLYQNAGVYSGEGFSTMVPKVESLTGAKIYLPYISFKNCSIFNSVNVNFAGIPKDKYKFIFRNHIQLGSADKIFDLSSLNIKGVSDLSYMFTREKANTSKFTKNMNTYSHIKLGPLFDMTDVETLEGMFYGFSVDKKAASVKFYNTDSVPKVNATKLKSVRNFAFNMASQDHADVFETSPYSLLLKLYNVKIEDMAGLFRARYYYDTLLPSNYAKYNGMHLVYDHILKHWDTSNLKDISGMFAYYDIYQDAYTVDGVTRYYTLDRINFIRGLNTSNVTTIEALFRSSSKYSDSHGIYLDCDLSICDFSSLQNASGAFSKCGFKTITVGPSLNGTLTNINNCFGFTGSYQSLELINAAHWDLSSVINCGYCVQGLTKLTTMYFGKNLGKSFTKKQNNYSNYAIDISKSSLLSTESVLYLFNQIYDLNLSYDVANGGKLYTQKIDLHADVIAKLTPEEIAIATNKGWTVV